jgi:hypothetical protein
MGIEDLSKVDAFEGKDGRFHMEADLIVVDEQSMTRKDGRGVMYIVQVHIPQAHAVAQIFSDVPSVMIAGFGLGVYKGQVSLRVIKKV